MMEPALDGAAARPSDRWEMAMVLLVVGSASVAMVSPTPLLQRSTHSLDDRVEIGSRTIYDLSGKGGSFRIEVDPRAATVRLRDRDGRVEGPFGHRALDCHASGTPLEYLWVNVYRRADAGGFDVELASECDSGCCDARSMAVSARGRRLDDGMVDRITRRLGLVGRDALGLGAVAIAWRLAIRRSAPTRIAAIVGLGVATAMLWANR